MKPFRTIPTAKSWRVFFLWLFLGAAAVSLGGCDSGPKVTRDDVMSSYQHGDFEKAYTQGSALVEKSTGQNKAEAQFVAGMSAYRTKRSDDAIRLLAPIADNTDKRISGPSNATLGLIYSDRGQYEKALDYFKASIPRLDGESLAEANFHAGATEQKIGHWSEARSHLTMAAAKTGDAGLKETARQRMNATGFTLQFGAYNDAKNAEEQAAAIKGSVTRGGLGDPRVIGGAGAGGRKLFLVQAGSFNTYDLAVKGKQRLGRADAVIATTQGGK
jgi:tetratricopeptide (TPR) repeat protein